MIPQLNRRDALRLLTGTTLALISARWARAENANPVTTANVLTPELTEGPYYIDLERIRRDITEGKPGLPLRMRVRVVQLATGAPVPDAAVDVWHCDAQGVYSGFDGHLGPPPGGMDDDMEYLMEIDSNLRPNSGDHPPGGPPPGGPGPGGMHKPDNKQTFLRGVQITNKDGLAEIDTIFPGWYQGRTTHIHLRVHNGGTTPDGRYQGGHISHTGQVFFPEDITSRIYQLPAYAKKQAGRMALNEDGIYRSQMGQPLSQLTPIDPKNPDKGMFSDTVVVIDPTATPTRM